MQGREVFQGKADIEPVDTGLDEKSRSDVANALCRVLADTYTLYLKTQGFHWNVVGPLFYSLHQLTEEQYKDLAEAVDELAERIRALGYPAPASFGEFAALRTIEDVTGLPTGEEMIGQLVKDHEAVAREMRNAAATAAAANDDVTNDLLTGRLREHEKAVWMLRALVA